MDMLSKLLLLNLILSPLVLSRRRHHRETDHNEEFGGELVTSLRNDINLDLSMDEEYEDLRAELLAYHTALSSLTGPRADGGSLPPEVAEAVAAEPGNDVGPDTRRSMKTTPCWQLGGICINHKMCEGHRFLTEVHGCRDKLEVCCFTWNKYKTRDLRDKGIKNAALPWSVGQEFGGKGPIRPDDMKLSEGISKERHTKDESSDILAYDLSSIETQKKKNKKNKKMPKLRKNEKKSKNSKKQKQALVVVLKPDKK